MISYCIFENYARTLRGGEQANPSERGEVEEGGVKSAVPNVNTEHGQIPSRNTAVPEQ